MTTQTSILEKSYRSLWQQFGRIEHLLTAGATNPLGHYAGTISGKFSKTDAAVRNLLDEMRRAIDEQRYADAWSHALELQNEKIPLLASELLAVIGGLYLIDGLLSEAWRDSTQQQEYNAFARSARELIGDLRNRSGRPWSSVLIVGEERVGYTEAEIIRLRFPACDIWHLPFTAHEYGWLVAKLRPPDDFAVLRDRVGAMVRSQVTPAAEGSDPEPPADAACYLPEVQLLWKQYRDALAYEKQSFAQTHSSRLTQLAERQKDHLCRLFADAFATLFAGPAYVYALIHLRFLPDESLTTPQAAIPAFAERFVFALETLRWMNGNPRGLWERPVAGLELEDEERPFFRELNRTEGMPRLWQDTLAAASANDPYEEVKKRVEPWLAEVIRILQEEWASAGALGQTYNCWREARQTAGTETLADRLHSDSPTIQVSKFPDDERDYGLWNWTVLNAAWAAFQRSPSKERLIEQKAAKLLARDESALRPETAATPQAATSVAGNVTERDVSLVLRGLAKSRAFGPRKQFQEWHAAGNKAIDGPLNEAILEAIGDNDEALNAYLRLTGQS